MSINNSHKISNYYDFYRDKEIIFTKANLKFLRMDPRQIYVKCNGGQWPCILNSSSLQMAKILVGTSSGFLLEVNKNKEKNQVISLRYCFFDQNNQPIQFFVNCNIIDVQPYKGTNELALMTLEFTQRPPDDLISRIGEFLEVNQNFETRKEERIAINQNSLRLLNIPKEESFIFIADVPRKCILKDLSFGGCKILTVGIPKFLIEKRVDLRLIFIDTNEKISIPGTVKNADFLPGRKDIAIVHIEFASEEIPMTYKFHINSYITSYQKQLIDNQFKNQIAERNAEVLAQQKAAQIKAAKEAMLKKANEAIQGTAVGNAIQKVEEIKAEIKDKVETVKETVKADVEAKVAKVSEKIEEIKSSVNNSEDKTNN